MSANNDSQASNPTLDDLAEGSFERVAAEMVLEVVRTTDCNFEQASRRVAGYLASIGEAPTLDVWGKVKRAAKTEYKNKNAATAKSAQQ